MLGPERLRLVSIRIFEDEFRVVLTPLAIVVDSGACAHNGPLKDTAADFLEAVVAFSP